ncbi:hypothetical protein ABI582_22970 [Pseudomonas sp. SAS7]|uniref:hypothetical protein n=1 Tax=Pseudomonas sp. SAS7 TaxID=3156487 RepID=UPI003F97D33A
MVPLDLDLCRVTQEHYITGKAAINFYWPGTTTGDWHRLSFWDKGASRVRVALAGIHYPDTSLYLGSHGVVSASRELKQQGWTIHHEVYMADHFRAAADMAIAWALGESKHCSVELADWFPDAADFRSVVVLLESSLVRLDDLPRERIRQWISIQLRAKH